MASRFWVGGTGVWDATDTTHWSATSNGAGGQSVPTSADAVTINSLSGTSPITVNGNHTVFSLTWTSWAGTLDFATNNNNFTCGTFSSNAATARTLNMGSGTFTVTTWNAGGSGLTFNPGTARIIIVTNTIGGKTLQHICPTVPYEVTAGPATNGAWLTTSAGNSNFGTLNLAGPLRILINSTLTWTVATLNMTGRGIDFRASSSATTASLSKASGLVEFNWSSMRGLTCTGGATFKANNSFDLGFNSGITFSPPRSGLILGG